MNFREVEPTSKVLKSRIHSFYFLKSDSNTKTEFTYYPHFIDTINIFFNASVSITNNAFEVNYCAGKNEIILSASKTNFRNAVIEGQYDVIGVNLLPLSLHYFLDPRKLTRLGSNVFKVNEYEELNNIAQLIDQDDKVDELERFFIARLKEINFGRTDEMLRLIHDLRAEVKLKDFEHRFGLSRRTILRRFRKYLFCSFEEYKNIVRFRLAIDNFKKGSENASNLLNDVAYYDQSDFIHHFKFLTGESPKKLLKYIKNNPDSMEFFWKVLNKQ